MRINNIHIDLHRMSHEELVSARAYAERRIEVAWEDITKVNGELALRGTVEFEPVQLQIELGPETRY
jgi:hypothetical protein